MAGAVIVSLEIAGMTAVHAVRAVFTSLAGVEGVTRADVSLGRAIVEHDGRATPEAIRDALALAGYELSTYREERRALPLL